VPLPRKQHALEKETPQRERLLLKQQLQRERDVQLPKKAEQGERQRKAAAQKEKPLREKAENEKQLKEEDKQSFRPVRLLYFFYFPFKFYCKLFCLHMLNIIYF
jgi:hypothetical protein